MTLTSPQSLYALVIGSEPAAVLGVLDRLRRPQRFLGAGFSTTVGVLAGQLCAVTSPTEAAPPDFLRLLTALRTAHQPQLAIGLGFSQSRGVPLGAVLLATRVTHPTAGAFQLTEWSQTLNTGQPIEFCAAPPEGSTSAVWNTWSFPLAAACAEWTLPVVLGSVATDDERGLSPEAANVVRRQTVAGKAGALLRMAWSKPSAASELWRRQSHLWDSQALLAELAEEAVQKAISKRPS